MLDPTTPIPGELAHESFVATPLTADLVELDHAAYVASRTSSARTATAGGRSKASPSRKTPP